jgi:hypothetical protein
MNTDKKVAKIMKALANGKTIQQHLGYGYWNDLNIKSDASLERALNKIDRLRVKPSKRSKKDYCKYIGADSTAKLTLPSDASLDVIMFADIIKITFDGKTDKVKSVELL